MNDSEELHEIIELMQRQLIFNINQNFGNFKSDFFEPLDLIAKLLKTCLKLGENTLQATKEVGSI